MEKPSKALILGFREPAVGYRNNSNDDFYKKFIKDVQVALDGVTELTTTADLGAEKLAGEAFANLKLSAQKNGGPVPTLNIYQRGANQAAKWPKTEKDRYDRLLTFADNGAPVLTDDFKEQRKKRYELYDRLIEDGVVPIIVTDSTKGCRDKKSNEQLFNYDIPHVKNKCKSCDMSPLFLDARTGELSETEPMEERERLVSEERVNELKDEIARRKRDKDWEYSKDERDYQSNVYKEYINLLTLRPEHRYDLLKRGFTDEQIAEYGYKSMPRNKDEMQEVISKLMDKGFDLTKAPGFTIAEDGGEINSFTMADGYCCPAWDTEKNRVIGFQIRNCSELEKERLKYVGKPKKFSKYVWLSSTGNAIGLSSGQPSAYYKGDTTVNIDGKERPVILITEGVLKCNLASVAMGRKLGIVGMAGVYGENGLYVFDNEEENRHLFKDAIILVAFDADMATNKNVRNASYRIKNEIINKYGAYASATLTWADEGKGIDDYVAECNIDGKDIKFNISDVCTTSSPTEVVINEFGKRETRYVESASVEGTAIEPLGNTITLNTQNIRDNGCKIKSVPEIISTFIAEMDGGAKDNADFNDRLKNIPLMCKDIKKLIDNDKLPQAIADILNKRNADINNIVECYQNGIKEACEKYAEYCGFTGEAREETKKEKATRHYDEFRRGSGETARIIDEQFKDVSAPDKPMFLPCVKFIASASEKAYSELVRRKEELTQIIKEEYGLDPATKDEMIYISPRSQINPEKFIAVFDFKEIKNCNNPKDSLLYKIEHLYEDAPIKICKSDILPVTQDELNYAKSKWDNQLVTSASIDDAKDKSADGKNTKVPDVKDKQDDDKQKDGSSGSEGPK